MLAVSALKQSGHDVDSVQHWTGDPGDESILAQAFRQERVLVTLDKDFGELAVSRGHRHVGIVRLVGIGVQGQASAIEEAVERYELELRHGAIVTVETNRIRLRLAN